MVKVFLDDIRFPNWVYEDGNPLDEWIILRSYNQFENWLKSNLVVPDVISFDHDLGYHDKTGLDVAKLLGEFLLDKKEKGEPFNFPDVHVHSMNPVGGRNIREYMGNLKKHIES